MAKIIQISKKDLHAALKALGLPLDNVIYSAKRLRDKTIEIRIPGSNVPLTYKPKAGKSDIPSPS